MIDLEYIFCPLCGVDDTKFLFNQKDFVYKVSDIEFPVVRCRHCGMVYVNPRPTAKDIHFFYTDVFYDVSSTPEQTILEKCKVLQCKYDKVKDIIPGTLLDIGCSKGEFMFMMKNRGWSVKGLDFSSKPPNIFNLDIHYGDINTAPFEKESFDLITLWAVLEHVYEPKEMLGLINRLLKPGGKLVILVPNFNTIPGRFMRHDDVPRHTNMFTKKTIAIMLNRTGFKPMKFFFDQGIFSGSLRGFLNYCVKLIAGEKIEEIVFQNRTFDHWHEFSSQLNKKNSNLMEKIDSFDITISPWLDQLLDRFQFGFTMSVISEKMKKNVFL